MAYIPTNIIARNAEGVSGGLDDLWGSIKGGVSSAIDFYGQTQQQAGANAALTAQNQSLNTALTAGQGGGISPMVLLGGAAAVVVLAVVLTRK